VCNTILRLPEVLKRRARCRSSHYLDINNGLFPKPINIGLRAVSWLDHEVDAVNNARIAGKTDDQIRKLVIRLELARKNLVVDELE